MSAASKILNAVWYSLIIILAAAFLSGSLRQTPVLVSFTASDSMQPAMGVGDLFFILPRFVSSSPGSGDVIVFRSEQRGYLVHRVVGVTPGGLITRGDNSPFTDQDGGEPPVIPERIVGQVVSIQGRPITLGRLGVWLHVINFYLRRYPLAAAAGVLVVSAVTLLADRHRSSRRRLKDLHLALRGRGLTVAHVMIPALLLLALSSLAVMKPGGGEQLEIRYWVSGAPAGDDGRSLYRGQAFERELELVNAGLLPHWAMLDLPAGNIQAAPTAVLVPPRGRAEITISGTAEREDGSYVRGLGVRRYLPLLPASTIVALHGVHPLLPYAVLSGMLLLPFCILFIIMGPRQPLSTTQAKRARLRARRIMA